jgi:hypothetical protein
VRTQPKCARADGGRSDLGLLGAAQQTRRWKLGAGSPCRNVSGAAEGRAGGAVEAWRVGQAARRRRDDWRGTIAAGGSERLLCEQGKKRMVWLWGKESTAGAILFLSPVSRLHHSNATKRNSHHPVNDTSRATIGYQNPGSLELFRDVSTLSTVTKASNKKGQEKRRKNIESKHVSIRCIGVCVRSWIIIRIVLIVTFAFRKMQQKKLPTKKAM